jgi:hypothetical protein
VGHVGFASARCNRHAVRLPGYVDGPGEEQCRQAATIRHSAREPREPSASLVRVSTLFGESIQQPLVDFRGLHAAESLIATPGVQQSTRSERAIGDFGDLLECLNSGYAITVRFRDVNRFLQARRGGLSFAGAWGEGPTQKN